MILVFLCDLFQINCQTFKKYIIQIGQVFLKILKRQTTIGLNAFLPRNASWTSGFLLVRDSTDADTDLSVMIGGNCFFNYNEDKPLGLKFDNKLNFEGHVSNLCTIAS